MFLRALLLIVGWFAILAGGALLLSTHLPVAFIAFVVVGALALAVTRHRSVRRTP